MNGLVWFGVSNFLQVVPGCELADVLDISAIVNEGVGALGVGVGNVGVPGQAAHLHPTHGHHRRAYPTLPYFSLSPVLLVLALALCAFSCGVLLALAVA